MNIILLVVVGLVFWHLFGTKGDSIAATPAAPSSPPATDNTTIAQGTGDVTTSSATP